MRLPSFRFCLVACLVLLATSCNLIETRFARNAQLSHMVPALGDEEGTLECWLTLEFNRYPEGRDLRDVKVRFESIALAAPAEFDWDFIAANDKRTSRDGFGSGHHREAEITTTVSRPPLGHPTQVRFPLRARSIIEDAPAVLYLEAELFWGGEKQHSMRQTIEHIYATQPSG